MFKLSRKIVGTVAAAILGGALVCGAADKPETTTETIAIPNTTVKLDLVKLPAGKVTVKSKDGKEKEFEVKSVWMAKLETCWDEYDIYWQRLDMKAEDIQKGADAENRPSKPYSPPDRGFGHNGYPAGSVTYAEAQKYVKWLSKTTGKKYRLATQAEWIHAARAGGAPVKLAKDALKDVAWFEANSEEKTHDVGKKKANPWGLHDMLGNVAEWTVLEDGTGIAMGGSFQDEPGDVTSENGEVYAPAWQRDDPQDPKGKSWLSNGAHIGIRVVRED